MNTNLYTTAIGNIHVSEDAIEAALSAAKLRAAKTASAQAKLRYAAIAASVVLAGTASAVYFGNVAQFKPPVNPSPLSPTAASTNAVDPTEPKTIKETTPATEKPTASVDHTSDETDSTESEIKHSETNTAQEPTSSRQRSQETEVPAAPSDATAETAPTEPPMKQNPLPEVDSERLCTDGKLYITIAETGLEHIEDPEAFTDDHLYYIETKFGRYYQIKPIELEPFVPSWIDQPKSDEMVYLYNSDGEIVGLAPVWW